MYNIYKNLLLYNFRIIINNNNNYNKFFKQNNVGTNWRK